MNLFLYIERKKLRFLRYARCFSVTLLIRACVYAIKHQIAKRGVQSLYKDNSFANVNIFMLITKYSAAGIKT